jgi:hypothetical protein
MLSKNRILYLVVIGLGIWLFVRYVLPKFEGFSNPDTKINPPCPQGYRQCPSGDCVPMGDPHQTCPEDTDAY